MHDDYLRVIINCLREDQAQFCNAHNLNHMTGPGVWHWCMKSQENSLPHLLH